MVHQAEAVQREAEIRNSPQPPRNRMKWAFLWTFSKCLKVMVAAVGLEPTTYGL